MMQATTTPALCSRPHTRRRYMPLFGTATMLLVFIGGGFYALLGMLDNGIFGRDPEESEYPPPDIIQVDAGFRKWNKPNLALIVSAQMHGYTDPCGCSRPQHGGLERRYNFIDSLKKKKWDVVGIDMGELASLKGIHEQNLLKYELSIRSLGLMNYRIAGVGRDEIRFSLEQALVQIWDEKKPYPRLISTSLAQTGPKEKYHELNVRPYEIIENTTPKVGVINVMGPDLRDELKAHAKFLNNLDQLPKALDAFAKAGVEIGMIMYHEYPAVNANIQGIARMKAVEAKRTELARKCAEFCDAERKKNPKIPAIQLMMVLTDEPEPPSGMRKVADNLPTQIIEIGHKGKYVGLVGIYREGKTHRLQYQMVDMNEDWLTKEADKATHPIIAQMQNYNDELKRQDMLAQYPRTPHSNQVPIQGQGGLKATYVGSDRCADCHPHAYKVWEGNKKDHLSHFKAAETLENEKFPSGRHFDPECMKCHTTGFQHPGGYNNLVVDLANWPPQAGAAKPNAKKAAQHNLNLRGVGCESCHGPASEHVKNPNNKDIHKLINPYAPSAQERTLEAIAKPNAQQAQQLKQLSNTRLRAMGSNLCMKCHDSDNDVNWGQPGNDVFDKWIGKKLIHRTPKGNAGVGIAPILNNGSPPPFEIEIIQDKKK